MSATSTVQKVNVKKTPAIKSRKVPKQSYWFAPGVKKPAVMKAARMLHGYLSAFAFLALMFFALTGLLLNHPEWLESANGEPTEVILLLSDEQRALILDSEDPIQALDQFVSGSAKFIGAFKSGEDLGEEIMLRYSSAKGATTVFADLVAQEVSIETTRANMSSVIRELHRGKDTANSWKFMIDFIAVLTLALSLIGFFLFFTIKFRLKKSLLLCGSSLAIFLALYVWAIP
ncbi:MAG: PepSY-associated TM helix domain-containing protein [Pseudomonadota bacterium]